MRTLLFILFIGGAAAGLVFGHIYLFRRLVRDVTGSRWLRRCFLVVILMLAALAMLSMGLPRVVGRDAAGPLVFGGLLWMGTAFYVVVLLGLADLVRGVAGLVLRLRPRRPAPVDPSRRQFIARVVAGTALAGSGTLAGLAVRAARVDIVTPEVPVRLDRLPPQLAGYRIALISDMHLGPTLGAEFTRMVVEKTNALRPDAVAITGDLVDGFVPLIGSDVAPLAGLQARHGVYFTTGNHEYYVGVQPWLDFLPSLGLRVLANERVELGDDGPGGARFYLAGIHDRRGGWFSAGHAPDPAGALAGRDPDREVVVMAHQPAQADEVAKHQVGLQLSGHTHGGQIFPIGLLTRISQPYLSGLHRHSGRTQVYVTRGTGYWGPPMRVLAPAEISLIVLTT